MTIEIKRLDQTTRLEIYEAFAKAFANYVIPVEFNQAATLQRLEIAGVRDDLSYGVFDNSNLVAFILQTSCHDILYNFGTGVIPSHRGQHLIELLYSSIENELPQFNKYTLEVIKENTKAHNLYLKLGFEKTRELLSFNGTLKIDSREENVFNYHVLPLNYTEEMASISLFPPSLEHSSCTTLKCKEVYEVHELRYGPELMAYAVFNPKQTGLKEIGAKHPIDLNLDQLFLKMKLNQENLRVMNIDEKARDFIFYLESKGLKKFITQYEMYRKR